MHSYQLTGADVIEEAIEHAFLLPRELANGLWDNLARVWIVRQRWALDIRDEWPDTVWF
jgi:hypothetical protein